MFTLTSTTRAHVARSAGPGLLRRLRLALVARSQRRVLARADARMLRDIGITREQAWAEASRPLWDVPATWLR